MPIAYASFTPIKSTCISRAGDVVCEPEVAPIQALLRWRESTAPMRFFGRNRIFFLISDWAGTKFSEIAELLRENEERPLVLRAWRPTKALLEKHRKRAARLARHGVPVADPQEGAITVKLKPNAFHSRPHPFFVRDAKVKPAPYRAPVKRRKKRK